MNNHAPERDPTPEEIEQYEAELDVWFDAVGLKPPANFQDESLAPPVREDVLRSLLQQEMPELESRAILLLVISYLHFR